MCAEYLLRGGQVALAQMNNSCVPWLFYGRRMQSILGAVIRRCNIYDMILASTQMCPMYGTQAGGLTVMGSTTSISGHMPQHTLTINSNHL